MSLCCKMFGGNELSPSNAETQRIIVIYTGGTIGMIKNEDGVYVPAPKEDFLEKIRTSSELNDPSISVPENHFMLPGKNLMYTFLIYDPLLDSSNLTTENWLQIAKDIGVKYNDFDGFVVLHGTDTMAYTSSALSFLLVGLAKTVVLSGSQVPIFEFPNDAINNLYGSLFMAGESKIPEVCVYFGNKLMRGNRTSKFSSTSLDAFRSPNYDPLAVTCYRTNKKNVHLPVPKEEFHVIDDMCPYVFVLYVCPTLSAEMIEVLINAPIEGIVLASFGMGNIPHWIQDQLKNAVEKGILIVNITQCFHGTTDACYETGQILETIGVVPGYDMTIEAALTKLAYVLGLPELSSEERKKLMATNLRGEMTM